ILPTIFKPCRISPVLIIKRLRLDKQMPNTQSELTDNNQRTPKGATTIDRTGVQSSLPFSRSIHCGHSTRDLPVVPHRELVSHPVQSAGSNTSHETARKSTFSAEISPFGVGNLGV
ncbi:MAG: hypothetical protein ACKOQX_02725, partial [Actinomycetota bacterium]